MKWCRTTYRVSSPHSHVPKRGSKVLFWPVISWLCGCETWGYYGLTVHLLKKNLHISGPRQFKPVLFKGQLYSDEYFLLHGNSQFIPTTYAVKLRHKAVGKEGEEVEKRWQEPAVWSAHIQCEIALQSQYVYPLGGEGSCHRIHKAHCPWAQVLPNKQIILNTQ